MRTDATLAAGAFIGRVVTTSMGHALMIPLKRGGRKSAAVFAEAKTT